VLNDPVISDSECDVLLKWLKEVEIKWQDLKRKTS